VDAHKQSTPNAGLLVALGEETDIGECLTILSEESEKLNGVGRGEAIPDEPDELEEVLECAGVFLEERSSLPR